MSEPRCKPIPDGMRSITPHLVCADALRAIEYYKSAFGAVENVRLLSPEGRLIHASLRIGDSNIMLAEEHPAWGSFGPHALKGSPVTIHLAVENVDVVVARAVELGATTKMAVAETFWGDRYGQIVDPFGHIWSVATHVRDVSPAEMQEAATKIFQSAHAKLSQLKESADDSTKNQNLSMV